ncbi:MAG: outer membrane beta-barrel protein [Flavobacteriales bacterium]|nr:outer membrane beta-barrel protein [Flavobacteriales bacterium]
MIKPIIPSNLLRAGDVSISSDRNNLNLKMSQKVGYSFGMIIRMGITQNWTFETGINYTKRNFSVNLIDEDLQFDENLDFAVFGYEIPLMAILNIRLGDKVFMNTAFGASVDMYPRYANDFGDATNYYIYTRRQLLYQPSLIANIGWEYRTAKNGILYLGGSFHRPFLPMYMATVGYITDTYTNNTETFLTGNYLTLDLRYYFHEEPVKRKTRKQRQKEKEEEQKKKDVFYRPGIEGKK